MTYETFVGHSFNGKSRLTIAQANAFLRDYQAQGYAVTLRQLYYRFVATSGATPVGDFENSMKSYKRFGSLMSKARLNGDISWTAINDNHREFKSVYSEERVEGAVEGISSFFAPDLWQDQDTYVEVWVEKDALSGVIKKPCNRFKVPYMACKGYLSSSEMWGAAKRFDKFYGRKNCVLIHLGDHDPSGVDMTRDNAERLNQIFQSNVEIRRIALNIDQVRTHNPPPNPTKITDSRAASYIDQYGHDSWELDALEPRIIDELVEEEIKACMSDVGAFNERQQQTSDGRHVLNWIGDNSRDVINWAQTEMDAE